MNVMVASTLWREMNSVDDDVEEEEEEEDGAEDPLISEVFGEEVT